ncbi:MAG TPA: hypothetical protein VJ375_16995 [Gaiellaceae bacterium]|nr:hypothetical protein [Gaiellaceae bacterium]
MLRRSLAATGLAALALAGVAVGSGKIIRLPGGSCATIGHTKVCAIAKTVTATRTKTLRLTTTLTRTTTATVTLTTSGPPLSSPPPVTTTTTATTTATVPTTTTVTTTTTVSTTTTVITTTPKPVAKLCVAPTEVDFGNASNVGAGSSIENIIQVSNCGDLPLTIEPPIVGDHGSPFQAIIEDLGGNGNLCPINSGTELLNPGAVCYVPIIFPRPAPAGSPWPHGSYQDTWYWRGSTSPGADDVITPYVHLTGTL